MLFFSPILLISPAWAAADGWYPEGGDQPAWTKTWATWSPDHGSSLNLAGAEQLQNVSTFPWEELFTINLTCAGTSGWPGNSHWPTWPPLG